MRKVLKCILPLLIAIAILVSIGWYLFIYDREFTRDVLLSAARVCNEYGYREFSSWLYDQAYRQSDDSAAVAIELARRYIEHGNYTRAEYTLSHAIADAPCAELYMALSQVYVEQDKLLDAVAMLENISDPAMREQMYALRPQVPTVSPAPGLYSEYITVSFTTNGGKLYTTTDGDYPSVVEDAYPGGIVLQGGENTIYAIVVGENGLVSEPLKLTYTVGSVIEEIVFVDAALEAHIRSLLGKEANETILSSELWSITQLAVPQGTISLADLKYMPYLTEFSMEGISPETLQPLGSLTLLQSLTITDCILSSSDLSVIAALSSLEDLTLTNCQLTNIEALAGAKKLTYLDLSYNTIANIEPLTRLSQLTHLTLAHNALTDSALFGQMTSLVSLDVSYNSLASIAPLAACPGLQELNLSHNQLLSLSGLEGLSGLTVLDASFNALTDVSLLATHTNLTHLSLSDNTILSILDLKTLKNLQVLDISNNEIDALPDWNNGSSLIYLYASHNKITSVKPLAGMAWLNYVYLDYNRITNVDALDRCPTLVKVNVYGNPVKNVDILLDSGIQVIYSPV